jgi:hypothetical protein
VENEALGSQVIGPAVNTYLNIRSAPSVGVGGGCVGTGAAVVGDGWGGCVDTGASVAKGVVVAAGPQALIISATTVINAKTKNTLFILSHLGINILVAVTWWLGSSILSSLYPPSF